MKQFIIFLSLNVLFATTFGEDVQNGRYLCAANTLSINSRLCIDVTEVPGHMYKDFLASVAKMKGNSSSEFLADKPDFKTWQALFPKLSIQEIEKKFFGSDEFALMPIVGITLEQAERFCVWRTEELKKELAQMDPRDRAQFPKEFKFRLPTAAEWSRVRFLVQKKPILKQINKIANSTKSAFKLSKSKLLKNNEKITHIYATQQPDLGFYNLLGNVSELTSEEQVAVGGSWFEPNQKENFQKTFSYDGPQAWLGFRCIFEIIK